MQHKTNGPTRGGTYFPLLMRTKAEGEERGVRASTQKFIDLIDGTGARLHKERRRQKKKSRLGVRKTALLQANGVPNAKGAKAAKRRSRAIKSSLRKSSLTLSFLSILSVLVCALHLD